MPDRFETERLTLSRFDGSELEWLYTLDNDADVMRYINGGTHTPRDFIERTSLPLFCRTDWPIPDTGFWKFTPEASRTPLGWCCLRSNEADMATGSLGYRLLPDAWGQGYATEASRTLLEHAFQTLELQRVVATTYEDNARSRRVLERLGFEVIRSYREDLTTQTTALFDGTEAFPGMDLEYELTRDAWLDRTAP